MGMKGSKSRVAACQAAALERLRKHIEKHPKVDSDNHIERHKQEIAILEGRVKS